jgi:glucosamine-6-phosphate deaminase
VRKLHQNENQITVAYQTSGNIAVFDHEVRRYLDFVRRAADDFGFGDEPLAALVREVDGFLMRKAPARWTAKRCSRSRRASARSRRCPRSRPWACARPGALPQLPFYQTGKVRKDPIGERDVEIILELLEELRPEILLVAGDLSDPHGTHRMCKEAVDRALERYAGRHRGVALPRRVAGVAGGGGRLLIRSPRRSCGSRSARSSSTRARRIAPVPGLDEREFWQRVEERNQATAAVLDRLGLPEYYAMEALVVERAGEAPAR